MITDRDITEKYGDKTAFEMWYNEIRLSSYSKFDEVISFPFLNYYWKNISIQVLKTILLYYIHN